MYSDRTDVIASHVVVRTGYPGDYRYALARDVKALPVVGPWRRTKKAAWKDGIAAVLAK